MDGDWAEVKKPKKTPKPQAQQAASNQPTRYGGKAGKVLVAGAVQQPRYGGQQSAAAQQYYEENSMGGNHA